MFDPMPIVAAGAVLLGVVGLPVLLIPAIGQVDLPNPFLARDVLPWPRGVQEEEPVRFRLDRPAPRRVNLADTCPDQEPAKSRKAA